LPIIENSCGDGSLGNGLAKNKFGTDMLGLLRPKTAQNLCYGLMNVSCSNGFASWGVVRRQRRSVAVVFLVIEKNWFPGVFALFNSTDAPLYCKNYLVLSQNCLSTEDFIYIWFLAKAATKFHIPVIQRAKKRYMAQKLYIMTLFQKNLNTYNCHNNLISWHVC
jgi:hypothetical protein